MIRGALEFENTAAGDEVSILAYCEECGRATQFPAILREKVEEFVSASAPPDDETLILAFCEECGRASEFPGRCRGTIQDCPHCGRYMDVEEDATDRPAANQLPSDTGASGMVAALQRLQKPIIFLILGGMAFYIFMLVASGIAMALGI